MGTPTTAEGLVGLLQQVHHALSTVAESVAGASGLSVQDLGEAVQVAAGIARLSDAVMARTVVAVEEQARLAEPGDALACRYGMRDAATLLTTVTGASRRTLKRWRQVGAATEPRRCGSSGVLPPLFPHLAEAVAHGAVSVDQALVIRQHLHEAGTRARPEDLDAAEQALVASAVGSGVGEEGCDERDAAALPLTPELLAVQARAWRDAIDPDGPEPAYDDLRRKRSFTLGQRPDGMLAGRLLLPPDQGEALRLALDAHNAPRTMPRYDEVDATSTATGAEGRAGGVGTDQRDAGSLDGQDSRSVLNRQGLLDDRTAAQRQADTLVGLVTTAMSGPDAPRIGGEPATLVVTISEAELQQHAETGGGTAHLEHTGEPVPAHVAARIICDGYLQACMLGDDGLPLKLGRARRSHTRHQRRAILTAYPGGCQNPGCEAPPGFTEIHHPVWWSDGGATDTDNGIPVCQHCHTEIHAGRVRCERTPAGCWRIVPSLELGRRRNLLWRGADSPVAA